MLTRVLTLAAVMWLEAIRKKDVYVLLILLGGMLMAVVSLDAFGLGGVARHVIDTGLLLTWIFGWILAVTVSSRELPREETRGTVFPLLAKPIARRDLIVGKWLGAWSVVCTAVLACYLLVLAVVLLKGGRLHGPTLAQGFLLHGAGLGIMCAMGLLFSTRLNADAAATLTFTVTAASYLLVPRVPELLLHTRGAAGGLLLALYHALPHLELFDLRRRIVHDYGPAQAGVVAGVLLYALATVALLLLLTWLAYRNKRFARHSLAS